MLERARTNSPAQSLAPERALDPSPDIESVDYADDEILLAHLLAHADTREAINLRQGALARASAMQAWWQPFRLTAGLAAAWLLIALAARGIESYQLHQRIDTLEARSTRSPRKSAPSPSAASGAAASPRALIRRASGRAGARRGAARGSSG